MESDARIGFLIKDFDVVKQAAGMEDLIRRETGFAGPIGFYRHHLCHLASAYYPSGFDSALLTSFDGIGEYETSMIGEGRGGEIAVLRSDTYPHSLGLLYSALTFYLGWRHHCDEGIIMGLAPYGDARAKIPGSSRTYYDVFAEILREPSPERYEVKQEWMAYYDQRDVWVSDKFRAMFGAKREADSALTPHHMNIAAALQSRLEDVVLN